MNHSRCPIGLDLGTRGVKMLQLERRGDRLAVVAAAARALPADLPEGGAAGSEAIGSLVKQMLHEGAFAGRRVVSCLPAATLQAKNLRLPRMPADELRAAVEWEASDRLGLKPDAVRVDFFDAGEVRQGEELRQEIILLSAPKPAIDRHIQMLSDCGLEPVAVEAAAAALGRCFGRAAGPEHDAARAIVDIGETGSKIVIARGGRVVFYKLVELGGQRFDEAVAQHLGLPPREGAELRRRLRNPPSPRDPGNPEGRANEAESAGQSLLDDSRREGAERAVYEALRTPGGELAKELSLCLRYYSVTFRGRRPETLLIAGGEARDPHLARVLAEGASIRVEPADPFEGTDVSRCPELSPDRGPLGEWAVAAGLSLRTKAIGAGRRAA